MMKTKDYTPWRRVPIVELCEAHVDCVNRTAPVVSEPTPFKMIRTTNVRNGFIDTENVRYVTEEIYKKWTRRLIPKRGDVIPTREAPLGEVGIIRTDDSIFLGQRLYQFRPDPKKLDADFLLYSLLGEDLQGQVRGFGSGATVEHMRLEDIPSLEITLPPLPVQQRIAGILSAYDDLIENSQQRIRLLEAMARALYREWFVHFRFPGHEKVPRVASPLGDIPKGWELNPIESFCPLVSRGVTPKYKVGSARFIINQKVNRGSELSLDDLKELEPSLEVPADKFARFGDVLVNCLGEGTIGRVHFYAEPHQNWAVDQHMSICRSENPMDSLYVYFALESPEGQGRITSLKTGGTNMTMFNISALRSFALVEPPLNLRARFAELTLPMMRQRQTFIELSRNLRQTRDLLLPRLIGGEIDVARVEEPEAIAV